MFIEFQTIAMIALWSVLGMSFIFWYSDNFRLDDEASLKELMIILIAGPAVWCMLVGALINLLAWGEDGTPKT